MKISFVIPPYPYLNDPDQQLPLGILYIASSVLKEAPNHHINIINLSRKYNNYQDIKFSDLYAFTATSLDYYTATDIAYYLKNRYPQSKFALGGVHSTVTQPEDIDSVWDYIFIGEAEKSFLSFLNSDKKQHVYRSIFHRNLDLLPKPLRMFVDTLTISDHTIFAFGRQYVDGKNSTMITSRGCPFHCAFCASPVIWHGKVRYRSAEDVINEARYLKEKLNVSQIRMQDDTISVNKSRLKKICSGLKELNIYWRASTRVDTIDEDKLKIMYDGGCREIGFGIESADQKVLNILNKSTTVVENLKAVRMAKDAGMVVRTFFMMGTPGETQKTLDLNIKFIEESNVDIVTMANFLPLPGTDIWLNPDKYRITILDRDIRNWKMNISIDEDRPPVIECWDTPYEVLEANRKEITKFLYSRGKTNE